MTIMSVWPLGFAMKTCSILHNRMLADPAFLFVELVLGIMYAAVGSACCITGQGIANLIMTAKRSIRKSEDDITVPPLVKSAALWGVFLAVSSNARYLVESSPLAK